MSLAEAAAALDRALRESNSSCFFPPQLPPPLPPSPSPVPKFSRSPATPAGSPCSSLRGKDPTWSNHGSSQDCRSSRPRNRQFYSTDFQAIGGNFTEYRGQSSVRRYTRESYSLGKMECIFDGSMGRSYGRLHGGSDGGLHLGENSLVRTANKSSKRDVFHSIPSFPFHDLVAGSHSHCAYEKSFVYTSRDEHARKFAPKELNVFKPRIKDENISPNAWCDFDGEPRRNYEFSGVREFSASGSSCRRTDNRAPARPVSSKEVCFRATSSSVPPTRYVGNGDWTHKDNSRSKSNGIVRSNINPVQLRSKSRESGNFIAPSNLLEKESEEKLPSTLGLKHSQSTAQRYMDDGRIELKLTSKTGFRDDGVNRRRSQSSSEAWGTFKNNLHPQSGTSVKRSPRKGDLFEDYLNRVNKIGIDEMYEKKGENYSIIPTGGSSRLDIQDKTVNTGEIRKNYRVFDEFHPKASGLDLVCGSSSGLKESGSLSNGLDITLGHTALPMDTRMKTIQTTEHSRVVKCLSAVANDIETHEDGELSAHQSGKSSGIASQPNLRSRVDGDDEISHHKPGSNSEKMPSTRKNVPLSKRVVEPEWQDVVNIARNESERTERSFNQRLNSCSVNLTVSEAWNTCLKTGGTLADDTLTNSDEIGMNGASSSDLKTVKDLFDSSMNLNGSSSTYVKNIGAIQEGNETEYDPSADDRTNSKHSAEFESSNCTISDIESFEEDAFALERNDQSTNGWFNTVAWPTASEVIKSPAPVKLEDQKTEADADSVDCVHETFGNPGDDSSGNNSKELFQGKSHSQGLSEFVLHTKDEGFMSSSPKMSETEKSSGWPVSRGGSNQPLGRGSRMASSEGGCEFLFTDDVHIKKENSSQSNNVNRKSATQLPVHSKRQPLIDIIRKSRIGMEENSNGAKSSDKCNTVLQATPNKARISESNSSNSTKLLEGLVNATHTSAKDLDKNPDDVTISLDAELVENNLNSSDYRNTSGEGSPLGSPDEKQITWINIYREDQSGSSVVNTTERVGQGSSSPRPGKSCSIGSTSPTAPDQPEAFTTASKAANLRKEEESLGGEKCHDLAEYGSFHPLDPSKYKTELCRAYQVRGSCRYGTRCNYAHGLDQLKVSFHHGKYKTRNCQAYHETGYCRYGARCSFIHDLEEGILKCSIANKEILEALHHWPEEDSPPSATVTWKVFQKRADGRRMDDTMIEFTAIPSVKPADLGPECDLDFSDEQSSVSQVYTLDSSRYTMQASYRSTRQNSVKICSVDERQVNKLDKVRLNSGQAGRPAVPVADSGRSRAVLQEIEENSENVECYTKVKPTVIDDVQKDKEKDKSSMIKNSVKDLLSLIKAVEPSSQTRGIRSRSSCFTYSNRVSSGKPPITEESRNDGSPEILNRGPNRGGFNNSRRAPPRPVIREYGKEIRQSRGLSTDAHLVSKTVIKRRKCFSFHNKGYCLYGPECQFIHDE